MSVATEAFDARKHVEMIQSPGEWVTWPILPLKHRRRKFADDGCLGFLVASDAPPCTVYVGLIFFIDSTKPLAEALKDFKTEEYADINALVEDWEDD